MASTWVRWSVAGLAAIFTLSLGYLVWGNWWLRRWLERSAATAGCELDYASAHTLYPGHFRLERVEVRDCYGGQLSLQTHSASGRLRLASLVGDAFEIEHMSVHAHAGRWGRVSWEGTLRIAGSELRLEPALAFEELRANLSNGVVRGARAEDLRIRDVDATASATAGVANGADVAIFVSEVGLSRGDDQAFPWLDGLEIEFHPRAGAGWLDVRIGEARSRVRGHNIATGLVAALHVAGIDAGTIVVDRGVLQLPGIRVADQSLHAHAQIDEARLSYTEGNRFRGFFAVGGSDAGLLLDLLRASESLRLTLSLVEGQAFVMRGLIDRSDDGMLLTQTEFTSEKITAQGSMRLRPSPPQGHFRVTYGSLRFGICAGPNSSDLVLEQSPWSLDAARTDSASAGCRPIFDPGQKVAVPGSS